MKHVRIALPEALADEAARRGLLADEAVAKMFEEAVRRDARNALLDHLNKIETADLPEITMEEINAEVRAARAERRRKAA